LFRSIASRVMLAFNGFVTIPSALNKVRPDLYSTQVINSGEPALETDAREFTGLTPAVHKSVTRDESVIRDARSASDDLATASSPKRFRRSKEEIRLGLSVEQSIALRESRAAEKVKKKIGRPKKDPASKPKIEPVKAKRFRRTLEEMRLGLSIEQAAAKRGVALSEKPAITPSRYAIVDILNFPARMSCLPGHGLQSCARPRFGR
jgi:hypothetical protein